MLKGLRWPFLVLVLASSLLVLALATQPDDEPDTTSEPQAPAPTTAPVAAVDAAPQAQAQQENTPSSLPTPVPGPENILVEGLVGEIHKLNPLLATYNPVDRDVTALIFEGLTTTNDYGEIIPDLAESWTVSDDGLEYIFVLRDDVLWQDGIPFSADDVVFTIDLISSPGFPGAASLHEFWSTVEVDRLSDQMVRFRLTQPLASFADHLRVGIVPAHVLTGVNPGDLGTHPFNLSPIGTGPYQFETLTASDGYIDGIQLRVAPVYRQRPEGVEGYLLDRVIFRTYPSIEAALDAYDRGDINSLGLIPSEQIATVQQLTSLSLYTTTAPRIGVLIYNWERDSVRFVRNPRVRVALAHAVNRPELVARYLPEYAIAADSPLLPNSWAYDPAYAWPDYDLEQAKILFESANFVFAEPTPEPEESEEAAEGEAPDAEEAPPPEDEPAPETEETPEPTAPPPPELAITLLTRDDPELVAMANDIVSGWAALGFTVSVDAVDGAALQTRLEEGNFDAAIVELSFEPYADPDPFVFWHQGQYGVGQNYGGMDDRHISEALELARRDANGIHRQIYYGRFQQFFAERVPALVLYYPLYTYGANVRLQGVQIGFISSPSDRFRHIQDWVFGE